MRIDFELTVVVLVAKVTGQLKTSFQSPQAGPNQPLELWCSTAGRFAAYNQDAYYGDQLRERRQQDKMVHPDARNERMTLVGSVWGAPDYAPSEYVELGRSSTVLRQLPLDEGR